MDTPETSDYLPWNPDGVQLAVVAVVSELGVERAVVVRLTDSDDEEMELTFILSMSIAKAIASDMAELVADE